MAKPVRRVFHPVLGAFFTELRKARGWKQAQAADLAARRGIDLSYQALRGLETGKTKWPSPEVLQQLAALYEVPYVDLVNAVVQAAYGAGFEVQESPEAGEGPIIAVGDEPSGTSAITLKARALNERDELRQALREIAAVATRLLAGPGDSAQPGRARKTQSEPRRRRRRAG